jgi:8-oxo-dGTP pyrophosphatase MutT (NUDIX family)
VSRRRRRSKKGSKDAPKDAPKNGEHRRAGNGPTRTAAPVTKAVSAGGVVYRREGEELQIALAARRTRKGELVWGLPKGAIEEGESAEDAAVRETLEETGLEAVVEAPLGDTRYFYVWDEVRIRKLVHMFLMRATGGDVTRHDDEMEEVRWFPADEALERAAYRGERQTLERAMEHLS